MMAVIENIAHARTAKEITDLHKAADEGDPQSQFYLGMKYRDGDGVDKDYVEAASRFLAAARQGHKRAQFELNIMYDFCADLPYNREEANKWLRMAAEPGLPGAQHSMSRAHFFPEGGFSYDAREGLRWLRMAALQNHADAQFDLGEIYLEGSRDRPRDYIKAYCWFTLAAAQGHEKAQEALGILEEKISNEGRIEAQKESRLIESLLVHC